MDPRYPIGTPQLAAQFDAYTLQEYARRFEDNAQQLDALVRDLTEEQLSFTYRAGSFTIRQLVHHVADAHEQGFARLRWGLTLDTPTILPMNEAAWAELPDYRLPPAVSLAALHAVNERWVALLRVLDPALLTRPIRHPVEGEHDLWRLLAKHEWHVRHHTAHVQLALGAPARQA